MDDVAALRLHLSRQLAHWDAAVLALAEPSNFAGDPAWRSLETYLDLALRRELQATVDRLRRDLAGLRVRLGAAGDEAALQRVRQDLVRFRSRYARAETVIDFYGDAVNARTGPRQAALLRACDRLAEASLARVLPPLGRAVPPVLTYVDKGMGASILRHGLRLWDPESISPAATIKITRHNLYRPTSLIHEAGHQAAFTLRWNEELADAFAADLRGTGAAVADAWRGWASEVAADAFAFAHTGYAAIVPLHDVVASEPATVFRYPIGDPHPIAYLRVLLGVTMCRGYYGAGPWDSLEAAWRLAYPISSAPEPVRELVSASVPALPAVARACLVRPMRAFGGRSLASLVDPRRVAPAALTVLSRRAGPALTTSPHWLHQESLRLLALSGYRMATEPERAAPLAREAQDWMLRLGGLEPAVPAAA